MGIEFIYPVFIINMLLYMNILIPLGGIGKRFSDEGYSFPKPLIKIFDKTMIEHVIDSLHLCTFKTPILKGLKYAN